MLFAATSGSGSTRIISAGRRLFKPLPERSLEGPDTVNKGKSDANTTNKCVDGTARRHGLGAGAGANNGGTAGLLA